MEDKENIIDLGSWNVPTDWKDITLKQYQELSKYYADKDKKFDAREVIHILCNKQIDEVNCLPMEFTEKILTQMAFLTTEPKVDKPSVSITVNGEVYAINVMQKMKTGEYIAVDTVLKSDPTNFATILAILARKEGEIYDSKFENEILEDRVKIFEQVPMTDAMKVINFFLTRYMTLEIPTQLSLEVQEGINLTAKSIKNSRRNGELSRLSTHLLMRRLKKLQKSIKHI